MYDIREKKIFEHMTIKNNQLPCARRLLRLLAVC